MALRIHDGQVEVTAEQVVELVRARFPHCHGLPVSALDAHGTETACFRVGEDAVARFPLVPSAGDRARLLAEQDHAGRVAAHVDLAVPEPLGVGEPGAGYPGAWTLARWVPGSTAAPADADVRFARDLARFVRQVHGLDTCGRRWDGSSRGGPLAAHEDDVRDALAAARGMIDTAALAAVWSACLAAPVATCEVVLHADLMPGNLIVQDGRLVGVIDLGSGPVGDPAVDLMPAWNLLDAPARSAFRAASCADDATWLRGLGWALVQAIVALPYYAGTFPSMATTATRTLQAVLSHGRS